MIDEFLEGVGSKLADRAVASIFSPPFLFFTVGVAAWVFDHGGGRGWTELRERVQAQDGATLAVVAVGVLLLLWAAGLVVQRLSLPVLRLLEGYWPRRLNPIRRRIVKRIGESNAAKEQEYQGLAAKYGRGELSAEESERLVWLDAELSGYPSDPLRLLPTRLGNVLRAAEDDPHDKYGLEATKVWVPLVLVVPATTKAELEASRLRLDSAVSAFIWSVLLPVWTPWAWWTVVLAVVAALGVYRWWALEAAARYGEVVKAAFDVHRFLLYETLRFPRRAHPKAERAAGESLSRYLVRGSDQDQPIFEHPEAGS